MVRYEECGGDTAVLTGWNPLLAVVAQLWHAAGHLVLAPGGQPGLAVSALAITVLAGALTVCLASAARLGRLSASVPLISRAALREKSWRTAFLAQRDPDAAGRPRPRAPSAVPAAADC